MRFTRLINLYCAQCDEWHNVRASVEHGMTDLINDDDGYCPECDNELKDS